jgi:hypothetical protein
MARKRVTRILGPGVRFALLLLFGAWALRFLFGTLSAEGAGPATVFAVLVLAGAAALLWRATLDMRRAVRRLRT